MAAFVLRRPGPLIDDLHITAPHQDQHLGHAVGLFRREQQMDVIGHQHVGVQPAVLARQRFAQPAKIGEAVLVVEEARRPIVPALDDVQR